MKKLLVIALLGLASVAAAPAQLINGAGSSFDYPAFTLWFQAYSQVDASVNFNYQSVGSGAGQKQLLNQTVDFGASDAPMSDESLQKAPGKILHLPVVAGAVVVSYNLPGNPVIKLDGPTLAGIFLGKITKWNDAAIAGLNPGLSLPDESIIVVHRSDGSGTSFIFTDYLSSVSPAWKESVGKGTAVKWPAGLGGKGNEGVSGQIKQLPGAVGYVELAYAQQNNLPFATLRNAAGRYVVASPAAVSAAMATARIPADFRFSMVNAPGAEAYPIAGASWVMIYQNQANADNGRKLVAFLRWAVTEGQKISPKLSYAPLPANVQERELKLLDTVTYGN